MNKRMAEKVFGLILIFAIVVISPRNGNTVAFSDYCKLENTIDDSFVPSEFILVRENPKEVVLTTPQKVTDDVKVKTINRGVPRESTGAFKTYMDFRAISDRSSDQYKLQKRCTTDEHGFRRFNEYYLCAMGTFYVDYIGQKFIITFDTGESINVMIGDVKQDIHTNETRQFVNLPNKNIVEFIVDTRKLDSMSKKMGNVSYSDNGILDGNIVKIEEIIE